MASVPIYVTNKTAGGTTGGWYVHGVIGALAINVVMYNVLGWGSYGLYMLGDKIL